MGVRRREGNEPCWGFVLLWRMQPALQAALEEKKTWQCCWPPALREDFSRFLHPWSREMPDLQVTNARRCLEKGGGKSKMVKRFFLLLQGPFPLLFAPVGGEG